MNLNGEGQLLKLVAKGTVLDMATPLSYILWISSRYSVKDLSGMDGVNSTTSPIFSLQVVGSVTGSWFSRGFSSSFTENPYEVHLELPRPAASNRSITHEFDGSSCTDICSSQIWSQTKEQNVSRKDIELQESKNFIHQEKYAIPHTEKFIVVFYFFS